MLKYTILIIFLFSFQGPWPSKRRKLNHGGFVNDKPAPNIGVVPNPGVLPNVGELISQVQQVKIIEKELT